ncbi:MAG: metal ABC transporter ATP-binding protein [Actinomycetota bacterium]
MSRVGTDDLSVAYGNVLALDGVTIDVPSGTSVAIIGPNGCGKSTLLKTLAGIVAPTSGTVQVEGRPAMVLQSTDVDKSVPITVRDAVAMGRYATLGPLRRFRPADWATIHAAMNRLAIDDLSDRPIHHLSGGQRQRVLVAQGLTQEAPALLLDEPLTGLDVASRSIILDVLDEEKLGGRTMIMSTHNFQDAQRCDLVLLLATRAIAFGTPDEVLTEQRLQEAFGGHFVRIGSTLLLSDPHHDDTHDDAR